jgi:hypothetical protein|tara:strand:- start:245 stop:682 length:438 start_codon:yes stop_codon:yes gene_type:complete
MKTFKQHINIKESLDGGHVGTPDAASFEDGSIGVHNIQDPEVLKRVNAFLGGTASKEYMSAQTAVEEIRNNLMRIGLFVPVQETTGEKGNFTTEVKFGGGRFGKDVDGSDINDDGISHKKEGGLKLQVEYETLKTGMSKVYAKLV